MLLLKLGSIAIVPVIYSVVLGEDAFFERMRVQGELLKMSLCSSSTFSNCNCKSAL